MPLTQGGKGVVQGRNQQLPRELPPASAPTAKRDWRCSRASGRKWTGGAQRQQRCPKGDRCSASPLVQATESLCLEGYLETVSGRDPRGLTSHHFCA
jgi:hypothetical protein